MEILHSFAVAFLFFGVSALGGRILCFFCSGEYEEWKWKQDHYISDKQAKENEELLIKKGVTPYGRFSYHYDEMPIAQPKNL